MLCYLKFTIDHGTFNSPQTFLDLDDFFDVDWAEDPADKLSTTWFILYLNLVSISWYFRKQKSVTKSFIELEYRAIAFAASKMMWVHSLLAEVGFSSPLTTYPIFCCDNMSGSYVCQNLVYHLRMKHIKLSMLVKILYIT